MPAINALMQLFKLIFTHIMLCRYQEDTLCKRMPFGLWKKKVQVTVDRQVDRQRQVDIGYATRQLENGDLSLVAGINSESFTISLDNISLLEPAFGQTVQGGKKGRIAKGLYFYVAQPQSPEPFEELIEIDMGTMTIAADGIVFAGRTRHIGIGFGAIESIGHGQNGISIDARTQKLHFGAGNATLHLKVQDRTYSLPLSGRLLRLLVEAVIKASHDRRDAT